MIVECLAYDALRHVVGHAHASVGAQAVEHSRETARLIVCENDTAHEHQHKAQIGERRENDTQGSKDVGIVDKAFHHIV